MNAVASFWPQSAVIRLLDLPCYHCIKHLDIFHFISEEDCWIETWQETDPVLAQQCNLLVKCLQLSSSTHQVTLWLGVRSWHSCSAFCCMEPMVVTGAAVSYMSPEYSGTSSFLRLGFLVTAKDGCENISQITSSSNKYIVSSDIFCTLRSSVTSQTFWMLFPFQYFYYSESKEFSNLMFAIA